MNNHHHVVRFVISETFEKRNGRRVPKTSGVSVYLDDALLHDIQSDRRDLSALMRQVVETRFDVRVKGKGWEAIRRALQKNGYRLVTDDYEESVTYLGMRHTRRFVEIHSEPQTLPAP